MVWGRIRFDITFRIKFWFKLEAFETINAPTLDTISARLSRADWKSKTVFPPARADRGSDPPEKDKQTEKRSTDQFSLMLDFGSSYVPFWTPCSNLKCIPNFILCHFGRLGWPSWPSFEGWRNDPNTAQQQIVGEFGPGVLWSITNHYIADWQIN